MKHGICIGVSLGSTCRDVRRKIFLDLEKDIVDILADTSWVRYQFQTVPQNFHTNPEKMNYLNLFDGFNTFQSVSIGWQLIVATSQFFPDFSVALIIHSEGFVQSFGSEACNIQIGHISNTWILGY